MRPKNKVKHTWMNHDKIYHMHLQNRWVEYLFHSDFFICYTLLSMRIYLKDIICVFFLYGVFIIITLWCFFFWMQSSWWFWCQVWCDSTETELSRVSNSWGTGSPSAHTRTLHHHQRLTSSQPGTSLSGIISEKHAWSIKWAASFFLINLPLL